MSLKNQIAPLVVERSHQRSMSAVEDPGGLVTQRGVRAAAADYKNSQVGQPPIMPALFESCEPEAHGI
jgi:hypothetical protein